MFIRIKKQKNKNGSLRQYLYIVDNQWINGKVVQKTVANLGRLDSLSESNALEGLAESIAKYTKNSEIIKFGKDLGIKSAKTYGPILIFRKLWQELGIDKILRNYFKQTNKEIDSVEAIFAMVCNRLVDPGSKRETAEWIKEVYEPKWEQLELHHFYRSLDFLVEQKDDMEQELFNASRNLFNCNVDVVMFDTTSVSYWGEGKTDLLKHGVAKNKRHDLKQLVVGIIMDQNGTPLGHEVWPGNMSDKPAFQEVIKKIKHKFAIQKVILVADRGKVSQKNMEYLEENGYEYILGAKMRQLGEIRQRLLLNDEGFVEIKEGLLGKEISEYDLWLNEQLERNELKKLEDGKERSLDAEKVAAYKASKKGNRKWAVCVNTVKAKEDEAKRKYFQEIIENKVEFNTAKQWLVKNGYRKYVVIDEMKIHLNKARLEEDALYDGKWVLISNTNLPAGSLIKVYKDLYQIERHFRDLKSELEIGPVRHWTEKRIRAHIFVCFLALQLRFGLTKRLKALNSELSYSEVMRDVKKLKSVSFELNSTHIIQRTDLVGTVYQAFKALGLAVPKQILESENLVATSVEKGAIPLHD